MVDDKVDSTGSDSGGSAGGEPSGVGVGGGKVSLGGKSSGHEAEEGSHGSGCKTTGSGMNRAFVVRVTAGAGTSPSRRNGIASLLFSSGRLSDMGGGMARVAGDGVGGAFRALATTGVTAGPPCGKQKALSLGVGGGEATGKVAKGWATNGNSDRTQGNSGRAASAGAGWVWGTEAVTVVRGNVGAEGACCGRGGAIGCGRGRERSSDGVCERATMRATASVGAGPSCDKLNGFSSGQGGGRSACANGSDAELRTGEGIGEMGAATGALTGIIGVAQGEYAGDDRADVMQAG